MKTIKLTLFIIIIILLIPQFLSAQCGTCESPAADYSKKIVNNTYITWRFVEGTSNAKLYYSANNYTQDPATIISTVKGAMSSALSNWKSAISGYDLNINFAEDNISQNVTIIVKFDSETVGGGHYNSGFLTLNPNALWTTNTNLIDENCNSETCYKGVYQNILHELAHYFLGAGHQNEDRYSVMHQNPIASAFTCCDQQMIQNFYNPEHIVNAKNSFGGNGVMKIDNGAPDTISAAGFNSDPLNWREANWNHSLEAVDDQTVTGLTYVQRFDNKWINSQGGTEGTNPYFPLQVKAETYTAVFKDRLNVIFQNSYGGGSITVEGESKSSPTDVIYVKRDYSKNASAQNYISNGIQYTFTEWKDDLNRTYTGPSYTFFPDGHRTYTAYFAVDKPVFTTADRGLTCPSAVGQPITLVWNDHENSSVSYKIYRIVKHNGVTGPETLVGTKPHGTTTFTDREYAKTSTYEDLIKYDVRAYYSPNGSYSDPNWISVIGEVLFKQSTNNEIVNSDYSLSNYPNPFNPSTNLEFNLPEAANVRLTIYNVLGEQVKEIANSYIPAGSYSAVWNGDNKYGDKVNSGIYFSVLETNKKRIVQKMILSK
ncbi:MAG: T9SS type A sorting domain-containing protein [Bacteroidetes bacterium]|nr:T9SS type A sorting domain-containing protein [Bacteroidota bacterium]